MSDTCIDQRKEPYPIEQYSFKYDNSSYISHDYILHDHNNNS